MNVLYIEPKQVADYELDWGCGAFEVPLGWRRGQVQVERSWRPLLLLQLPLACRRGAPCSHGLAEEPQVIRLQWAGESGQPLPPRENQENSGILQ